MKKRIGKWNRYQRVRSRKQRGKIPSKLKALLATLNFMPARTAVISVLLQVHHQAGEPLHTQSIGQENESAKLFLIPNSIKNCAERSFVALYCQEVRKMSTRKQIRECVSAVGYYHSSPRKTAPFHVKQPEKNDRMNHSPQMSVHKMN